MLPRQKGLLPSQPHRNLNLVSLLRLSLILVVLTSGLFSQVAGWSLPVVGGSVHIANAESRAIVYGCSPKYWNVAAGIGGSLPITATSSTSTVVSATLTGLTPTPTSGTITVTNVTPAVGNGGTLTANLTADTNVPAGIYTSTITFTDNQSSTKSCTEVVQVAQSLTIPTIRGAARTSPYAGQVVSTTGVVVGTDGSGFFVQDPNGDGNIATSDGIYVYTSKSPAVTLGDSYMVTGTVTNYIPSANPSYLAEPELEFASYTDMGAGPTITPTVITIDPSRVISGNPYIRLVPSTIYTTTNYNPSQNALDFYLSLEGMLVEVDNPRVTGPTTQYDEFTVVPDGGKGLTFDSRNSLELQPSGANSQIIEIGKDAANYVGNPQVNVGDLVSSPITGPLDYVFGAFYIEPQPPETISVTNTSLEPARETATPLTSTNQLRVASYNLNNFNVISPTSNISRAMTIANQIYNNLQAPDLIVLDEIQDNDGPTDDGVVNADLTLGTLRDDIYALSNKTISYTWQYINPVNDQDGGQPGGNIRQVFFFRTDRGLSFVNKPVPQGSDPATTADAVNSDGTLLYSPGRIAPTDPAFTSSRKPLAGEFLFNGQRLIVIGNHLVAKLGDTPTYGSVEPPNQVSESQRISQTTIIRNFVTQIQNANPNALVVVAGDLNDYEFSQSINILKNGTSAAPVATNQTLVDSVEDSREAGEKYTYNFQGNSEVLDQILYSQPLAKLLAYPQIVHINSDYAYQSPLRTSDHDPDTAVFNVMTTTTSYTYYLPFVANGASNFTTYLAFQNIGITTSNVTINYFGSNGVPITSATVVTQVAQYGEALPSNPLPNGTTGAGIITSDQPLNVIVPEATPYGGSAYAVNSGSSNSLIAPFALNQAFGDFTTQLNIFNGGSSAVTATVTFYGTVGTSSTITSTTTSVNIAAHTTANLNQNSLPSGFSGWAQITGTNNTLVAQVLEQSPNTKFVAIANAIANPSTTEYAPAIFNGGYGSFYTGANIINPNSNPVTVTVSYYDLSATLTTTTPFPIPAYGVASIFNGSTSGFGLPSGGLPKGFIGSVTVTSTGGPIAMSVNENGGQTSAGNSRSGTYAAIANGSSTVGLPVVSNGGFTYVTGDTILNTSSQPLTATITYYNTNGTSSGVSKTFTVAGHGSQAYYQVDGSLPANFYGTAVITETGGPANSLIVTTNAQNIALFYTYSEPNS